MVVVDRGGVGQRQRLAVREEIELVVGDVIGPVHRTGVGIAAGQRQLKRDPKAALPAAQSVTDR